MNGPFQHQPKTMEELLQITEVTSSVIRGRVQKINVDEGWFTYTCTKCNKKVAPSLCVDSNQTVYDCEICGIAENVFPRVRTTIRAGDATGECTLVLFDSQLSRMLKKSVSWLKEKADQSSDPQKFPAEFNEILLNPYVWHIKVSDFNLRFNYHGLTVENVTDDKEVFQVIDDKLRRDVNVTAVLNTQTVAVAPPLVRTL